MKKNQKMWKIWNESDSVECNLTNCKRNALKASRCEMEIDFNI